MSAVGFMSCSSLDFIIKTNVKALDHLKQEMIRSDVRQMVSLAADGGWKQEDLLRACFKAIVR